MKNLPTIQKKTQSISSQNDKPPQIQDAGARMPVNNKKILQNVSINCVLWYLLMLKRYTGVGCLFHYQHLIEFKINIFIYFYHKNNSVIYIEDLPVHKLRILLQGVDCVKHVS